MAEIFKKPPSQIKIRTLETDIEDMRKGGGGLTSGKILGRDLEEINQRLQKQEAITFFPAEVSTEEIAARKKKIPIIIIGTAVALGIIVGIVFYLTRKPTFLSPTTIPSVTPQPVSLLTNFNGPSESIIFDLTLSGLEKILAQQFHEITKPQFTKEIVLIKNSGEFVTAEEFLKTLFNNFEGIAISDQPRWEKDFSLIIYTNDIGVKSIAYVTKINAKNLTVFSLSNLKSRFSLSFEKLIEKNSEILTSQYLQNIGAPIQQFIPKTIGPITVYFIKFTTGAEFYYGFYNEYFILSTTEQAFAKILDLILIR